MKIQGMILLAIVLGTRLVGESQGAVLLYENWEDELLGTAPNHVTDNGASVHYYGVRPTVVTDLSGDFSARMDDTSTGDGYANEYAPLTSNGATELTWEYDINTLSGGNLNGNNAFVQSINFGAGKLLELKWGANQQLTFENFADQTHPTSFPYSFDQPYNVQVTTNLESDRYSVDINGTNIVNDHWLDGDAQSTPVLSFSSNFPTQGVQEVDFIELRDNYDGNLLKNASFEEGLPYGDSVFLERHGPSNSAAEIWTLWNNDPAGSTESSLVPVDVLTERLDGAGNSMARIETSHGGNGLVQVFGAKDTGPTLVESSAWVYVVSGEVKLGTGNGGNTGTDVVSTKTGEWEQLTARNGVWPANEIVLYSTKGSAEFYVDMARVDVIAESLQVGDSDLNGVFDSGDLVTVFTAGKYETGQPAGWEAGDWTGDGLFNTTDLVKAFQAGTYQDGLVLQATAVPEPTSAWPLALATAFLLARRRFPS